MIHRAIRICIVLLTIIAIMTIFLFKPLPEKNFTQHETEQYNIEIKKEDTWPLRVIEDPIAIFTFLLFLATMALYDSTKSLVNESRITSERQLRAYVGVKAIIFVENNILQISVQNFGQTPAVDYFVAFFWRDRERAIGLHPNSVTNANPNRSYLMPSAIDDIRQVFGIPFVPANSVVVGKITYTDIFNIKRFTDFRLVTDISGQNFVFDTFGNEAN